MSDQAQSALFVSVLHLVVPLSCCAALSCAAAAISYMQVGVDIENGQPKDLTKEDITDLYTTKWWALKLATDAAITILRVDQVGCDF